MKPISKMNLAELADRVESDEDIYHDEYVFVERLRVIHDLTRWIPVSERMPTQEDKDVLAWYATEYPFAVLVNWYEFPMNNRNVTHWKRITPPEGA